MLRKFLLNALRIANYDFCPSWNRFLYWLKEPVGWTVVGVVFSLLVGLFVGPQGYVLAFAFIALLGLGLVWPWVSMKGIRCSLVLPDGRVCENEKLDVVFRVKNYWPVPVFGMMVKGDFLQTLAVDEEPVAFSLKRVAAWSEAEFRIPIVPRRRGKLPSGDVVATNGFPFGLFNVSKTVEKSAGVLVWPSCTSLDGFPLASSNRISLQRALQDRPGDDGESIGVRIYRNGDRMRNVHWAQTARSQRLMVRERQKVSSTEVTVLIDLDAASHEGHGGDSSFEWAIRIAASICAHLDLGRAPVRIACIGLPTSKQISADNRAGIRAIMDLLAGLPGLEAALKPGAPSQTPAQSMLEFTAGGRAFLVGTERSLQIQNCRSKNVTPVMVSLAGFAAEDSDSFSRGTSEDHPPVGQGIFITTAETAAAQLAQGWDRSFDHAY
jgi:uncharacterized protein (DUF58 family)